MQSTLLRLIKFRDARDWNKYHTPEALARALSIEAGELNELFLWGRSPSVSEIAPELADVMIYALNMCIACGLDPIAIINDKISRNEVKYHV